MDFQLPVLVVTIPNTHRYPRNLHLLNPVKFQISEVVSLSTALNRSELEYLRRDSQTYFHTMGREIALSELGCAYGHLLAYQRFVKLDTDWALILEDDAIMSNPISDILQLISTTKKASVVSLIDQRGGVKFDLFHRKAPLERMLIPGVGTSAYLINRLAASAYLKTFDNFGILSTADWHYPQPFNLRFYSVQNPRFLHDWSGKDSTIRIERDSLVQSTEKNQLRGRRTLTAKIKWVMSFRSDPQVFLQVLYVEFLLKGMTTVSSILIRCYELGKKFK